MKKPKCKDCEVELKPSYARVDVETKHATYVCPECLQLYAVSIYRKKPNHCEKL